MPRLRAGQELLGHGHRGSIFSGIGSHGCRSCPLGVLKGTSGLTEGECGASAALLVDKARLRAGLA